jgi:hypothetical protein
MLLTPENRVEGDAITFVITNPDGTRFQIDNFFLRPETYAAAFADTGFARSFGKISGSRTPARSGSPMAIGMPCSPIPHSGHARGEIVKGGRGARPGRLAIAPVTNYCRGPEA